MAQDNPRLHAGLSAGLLIALLAVLLLPAIDKRLSFYQRLDNMQFQHRNFAPGIRQTAVLEEELKQLRRLQADRDGFLEDKPGALAAADLQRQLKILIESNGGNLISTQVVENDTGDLFPSVTVKVQFRSGTEALQLILYQLATGRPVLLTENLLIQQRNKSDAGHSTHKPEPLDIRFDATAYLYRAGPK